MRSRKVIAGLTLLAAGTVALVLAALATGGSQSHAVA
jgi:hypothetical protein